MSSNTGECDVQARSYSTATAPIDLQRKQISEKEYHGGDLTCKFQQLNRCSFERQHQGQGMKAG